MLFSVKGYPIWVCLDCGLTFSGASGNSLHNLYEEDYYQNIYSLYESDRNVHEINHASILDVIGRYFAAGKLLEIGSAFGFFLNCARRKGWKATGIEISDYASVIAREKYGAAVISGDILNYQFADKYNLVVMLDTIEHLNDPLSVVKKSADLLMPGGGIVLTTGNIRSIPSRILRKHWRLIHPPYHLYYFSPATITNLLNKCGFRVLTIRHIGKYFNFASIGHSLLGINKSVLPSIPVKINPFDLMTIVARLP